MIKYTKEDKKLRKEKEISAREKAKYLVIQNFAIDTEMFARKETGTSLGAEMGELNIPRSYPLDSPYQDWKISFSPEEDPSNFSLGYFTLSCLTEELNHYVELRSYSEDLVKIIFEQPEIERFSEAVKEGMRGKVLKKFIEDFNLALQPLSPEKRETVPVLVSKETRIARLERASNMSYNILSRFRFILPFELVVGKSHIDEAKNTLKLGKLELATS